VYFSFVSLLTIGYGDIHPLSDAGRAVFVLWSLLAVPSLTILISDMGDTISRILADVTKLMSTLSKEAQHAQKSSRHGHRHRSSGSPSIFTIIIHLTRHFLRALRYRLSSITAVILRRDVAAGHTIPHRARETEAQHHRRIVQHRAALFEKHISSAPSSTSSSNHHNTPTFHLYVLARECCALRKALVADPARKYDWLDWEYYLSLLRRGDSGEVQAGEGDCDRDDHYYYYYYDPEWSWLSARSPLACGGESEGAWLLGVLSEELERRLREGVRGV
jgi:potassium channel subfamily K